MALNRVKLLTSNTYSPTNPASESDIRSQIDGSIQEIADLLAAVTDGSSGGDGVGMTPIPALGSANTIQSQMEAVVNLGVGTLPGNDVIIDQMLKQTGDNILPRTNTHIASTSNPHSTTIAQVGGSNKNLLHNWDFRNPVNQRGVSGTVSTLGYFFDRWKLTSGTVTINSGNITLNGTISQTLETAVGTNITSSVSVSSGSAAVTYDNPSKVFSITSSGGVITNAKLEYGTVSTISNDSPMDIGEQLPMCFRHQFNPFWSDSATFTHLGFGRAVSATQIYVEVPIPTSLRISPTLVQSGTLYVSGIAVISVSIDNYRSGLITLDVRVASGLTNGSVYVLQKSAGATILFDSNI